MAIAGLAGPAFAFGLGDAGQEVVADLFQSSSLVRRHPQEWAPDDLLTELRGIAAGQEAERWRQRVTMLSGMSQFASVGR